MLDQLLELIKQAKDLSPLSAQQLRVDPSPDEQSAQTPPPHSPFEHDASHSTHNSASAQPEIHNRIASRVVNQVNVIPFATSLLRPKDLKVRLARSIEWWRLNC